MRKIAVVMMTLLVVACATIDCPVQNTVYTIYHLKKAGGSADTLKTDTLTIVTRRADDTLTQLNQLHGVTAFSFKLPISYTQPEDVLYFELKDKDGGIWLDTIRIKKDNEPHFESVDCQLAYFHTITEVSTTHHAIDSIVVNNPYVNYDAKKEHFHLYFKAVR